MATDHYEPSLYKRYETAVADGRAEGFPSYEEWRAAPENQPLCPECMADLVPWERRPRDLLCPEPSCSECGCTKAVDDG